MKLDEVFTKSIKTCAIVGHVSPDGDAVGSTTALFLYIRKNYPWIDAELYIERPKESLMFLPGLLDAFFDTPEDSVRDLFVSCDVSSVDRFGVAGNLFPLAKKTFCIDHHISNPRFADINVVDADASSCSEVIYGLMDPEKIDLDIATSLYTGIIHDSGVFQYSNMSRRSFEIVGQLVEYGFDGPKIIQDTFYVKSYVQNQILGRALLESILFMDGKCIVSMIDRKMMEFYNVLPKHLEGIVNHLKNTRGVEVAIFMYEMGTQRYKVSMRSNGGVNVATVATVFGGGGHARAAGVEMNGTYYDVINALSREIQKQM